MAVFTARLASDGAVFGLRRLLPVASTVTATTMTRDTSHPNVHAAPFRTPRFEGSTTINAVSGSGSSAIVTPIRTRLSITAVPRLAPAEGVLMLTASYRLEQRDRVEVVTLSGQHQRRPRCRTGIHCLLPVTIARSLRGCTWPGLPGRLHEILVEPCRLVVTWYG